MSDLRDLERDLPTDEADLLALRAARLGTALSPADLVQLQEQLSAPTTEQLRARPPFRGEPFTLD